MTAPLERAEQAVAEASGPVLSRLAMAVGSYDGERDKKLVDALIDAVHRYDAELGRELSRQGYSAQEIANKIDPDKEGR